MASETETTEDVVTESQVTDDTAEVVEFTTIPDDADTEKDESEPTLWDALSDEENDVNTMVWHIDLSFTVGDLGDVREVFATTNKAKAVARIFNIVSSPDVKEPCDFDASQYTTRVQAIKAFFDGVDKRNLFIALVPLY